ncbi:hypothetical protein AC578_5577 [Lecanosticta acicola]|uniref:DUF7732 domain-containing protein n=1 Tax=Lecanosticta acicola TaxID=111012 RepID=A0AAI8YRB3_9PEZI|nr:hypothetical protein AC578_5577 [Lecanosticta acicola]
MQLPQTLLFLVALVATVHVLALPAPLDSFAEASRDLFKRKGGGGGGGRGGGETSAGGSESGGSSSSSSSSSSSGSGSSSSSGRTSGTSTQGGATGAGSGPARTYGGGAYYGGGAAQPYPSDGRRSPGGVAPAFLGGAALASLAIFPGLWLYGVYAYQYPGNYHWRNTTSNRNESGPVECLCQQYSVCGCDSRNDTDYLTSVANNNTIARRLDNGTLVINGTLPNGTTAPGGTDSAAPGLKQSLLESSGFWIVIAGVVYTVNFV